MITVLAATGFTGRLIAQELHRRRLPMRLAGRSADKLRALVEELGDDIPTLVADVNRRQSLPPALEGSRVLINCAGPFMELGEPVVAEAVRQGVHYLDTTGEQAFIKLVFDRYGETAARRDIVLAPATAFEYALADAAAELAARGVEPCDEIAVIYAVSGVGASRGTKKSVLGAISGRGYLYREGQLALARPGVERRSVQLPSGQRMIAMSFPGGEVFQVPKHVRTRAVIPMMAFTPGAARLLRLGLPFLRAMLATPIRRAILRRIEASSFGPTATERASSRFTILCQSRRDQDRRSVIVQGEDPYGLTAIVAVTLASFLLKERPKDVGAVSPAMVAGSRLIVESTRAAGVAWVY